MKSLVASFDRVTRAIVALGVLTCLGGTASAQGFSATQPKPGFGAVYIGRPFGWHTSVFALPVEIDGKPLAALGPNQYTRVEVGLDHTSWQCQTISGREQFPEIRILSKSMFDPALPTTSCPRAGRLMNVLPLPWWARLRCRRGQQIGNQVSLSRRHGRLIFLVLLTQLRQIDLKHTACRVFLMKPFPDFILRATLLLKPPASHYAATQTPSGVEKMAPPS